METPQFMNLDALFSPNNYSKQAPGREALETVKEETPISKTQEESRVSERDGNSDPLYSGGDSKLQPKRNISSTKTAPILLVSSQGSSGVLQTTS